MLLVAPSDASASTSETILLRATSFRVDSAAKVGADGRSSGARVHQCERDGKGRTVAGTVCEISLSFEHAPVREAHRTCEGRSYAFYTKGREASHPSRR